MYWRIHPAAESSRCKEQEGSEKEETRDDQRVGKEEDAHPRRGGGDGCTCRVLTVWKRSSMSFQGTDGFTVFDEHGSLVFRMDNYSRRRNNNPFVSPSTLVLMDAVGNALLTLRPQMLSLHCQWNAYRGEDESRNAKLFSMRSSSLLFHKAENVAEIFMHSQLQGQGAGRGQTPDFRVEGSFRSRDCKILNSHTGQVVAKILRKRVRNTTILLSDDVFSLQLLQPGFDTLLLTMAFVIILDRISSYKPPLPLLCS